jgi:23S rRNA (uridine2552-2'-O)-methyltransferase
VRSPRKDARYHRAKAEGFRARSAYKLAELDDRHRILRRGEVVVDLGAWPGGWLQIASARVGPAGRVVGIDVAEVPALHAPNVSLLQGDVRDAGAIEAARKAAGARAGVVLSDLAPKLTGIRDTDDARSTELVTAALDALPALLEPGGVFVTKLFMSADYQSLLGRLRQEFQEVKTTRPESTRRGSAELYAVCRGYRPPCG